MNTYWTHYEIIKEQDTYWESYTNRVSKVLVYVIHNVYL